jgi:hypothetical protein
VKVSAELRARIAAGNMTHVFIIEYADGFAGVHLCPQPLDPWLVRSYARTAADSSAVVRATLDHVQACVGLPPGSEAESG